MIDDVQSVLLKLAAFFADQKWLVIVLILIIFLLREVLKPTRFLFLTGQHVCVTGGSEGLGLSIAIECLKEGAKRVTILSRSRDKLSAAQETLKQFLRAGASIQAISADLSSKENVEKAIKMAVQGQGVIVEKLHTRASSSSALPRSSSSSETQNSPIDVLFCNASYVSPGEFELLEDDDITSSIDTILTGSVWCVKRVLPDMIKARKGSIIFINTQASLLPLYGFSVYSMAKAALRNFALVLDVELKPYNILVSSAYPPSIDTPGYEEECKRKPKVTALIEGLTHLMTSEDVARRILLQAKRGKRSISLGGTGLLLSISAGISAVDSLHQLVINAVFGGITNTMGALFMLYCDYIVKKNMRRNEPEITKKLQ